MTEMRFLRAAFAAVLLSSVGFAYADAPSALQCESISMDEIRVTWVDNSTNETGFVVGRTRDHVNWTAVTTTGVDFTSYTDSGLEAGIVYMYRVRAITPTGSTDCSNWHFAATMCPIAAPWTPYDVKASYTPQGHVVLTWSEHFGEETGFEIQRNVGLGYTNYATVGSNVTEFLDSNPPLGSNIYYMVRAFNSTTNTEWASTPAGVDGGTTSGFYIRLATIDTALPAPSNVVAEILGPDSVRITWDHIPTNQGGYKVLCSWDNRHFRQVTSTYSNITEASFARTIVPGYTYYIRVVAGSTASYSSYSLPSETVSFKTLVDPALPAPSDVKVFKPADYHIELSWKDNSTNETGFAIIGQITWVTNVAANVTNVTLTGSPNASHLAYTVRALNGAAGSKVAPMCGVSQTETPTFYGRYSTDETADPRTNAVIASGTQATSPVTITTKSRPYFTELQISGTSGNDHIVVSQSNDTIIVTANGQTPVHSVGPFGDIQVKGGNGNDTIIIDSSVSVRNRLYGEVGNDALNAFGSGKNILVTIGSGNDTCVGNGIDTSYWTDQSGVDTVHASRNEILAGRVHRVSSFYGGVTKNLYPGNLPDDTSYKYQPFSNGYSLWGECPTMFDVDQGHHQNCPMTGRQQMTAHQQMDRLQEMACDMGDNTYVVEYGDPSDRTYARVDSQLATSIAQMPPSENIWWRIIEKVTYSLGLGVPAPKTYYQRRLNVWDTDDAIYDKFKAELEAGRVIGDFVGTPEALGSDARIAGHYHGFAHVYRNSAGEPRFIIRNPYGQEFERNIPPFDPCQGLFDLSMDEMKAAFSQAIVTDYRVPPVADAGADRVVTDNDQSGDETVTLTATNSTHWRPLTFVWSENGTPFATGQTVQVTLSTGTHLISVAATDDDGAVGTDAIVVTVLHGAMPGFVGEAGTITTNQLDGDTWHSTMFTRPYTNPIVVMGPPSFAESDATTMRVRNVTPTGFEWQLDEWERLVLQMFWYVRVDGPHTNETVSWIVAEGGARHRELGDALAIPDHVRTHLLQRTGLHRTDPDIQRRGPMRSSSHGAQRLGCHRFRGGRDLRGRGNHPRQRSCGLPGAGIRHNGRRPGYRRRRDAESPGYGRRQRRDER